MMDCEYIKKCAYYNGWVDKMPETQNLAKRIYCHKDPGRCRRNQLAGELPVDDVFNTVFPLDGKGPAGR